MKENQSKNKNDINFLLSVPFVQIQIKRVQTLFSLFIEKYNTFCYFFSLKNFFC